MQNRKRLITASMLVLLTLAVTAPQALAKPSEYDKIVRHLKSKYQAKKVSLGFVWLARAAVKLIRPAGVKSFNVTLFKDLRFSRDTLDIEMQNALKNSFSPDWNSVFRMRSRDGQQAYMYMREDGSNIKMTLVTIDKEDAAVVRAVFSLEKLAEFINNPRIFGISLSDGDNGKKVEKEQPEVKSHPENKDD